MGVTFFARDPLRSYFDECQKNENYFLNIYILIVIAVDETVIFLLQFISRWKT